MLLNQGFGPFHLFLTAGTQFRVDRPGAQDQGSPLDPFARFGFFGQLLGLALLFGIQVAQGVGEVASIGNLVLAGAGCATPNRRESRKRAPISWGRTGEGRTSPARLPLRRTDASAVEPVGVCSSALAAGEVGRRAG